MADLAPFVATVLRDNVVGEMGQEIQELRERFQTVEIVKVNDVHEEATVCARALLQNGKYDHDCTRIHLRRLSKQNPCSLSDLPSVRVRVGGIQITDFQSIAHDGRIYQEDHRYQSDTSLALSLNRRRSIADMQLIISPVPSDHWIRNADHRFDDEENGLLQFLSNDLAAELPDARVYFLNVSMTTECIQGALCKLPQYQEAIQPVLARRRFRDHVEERMVSLGVGRASVERFLTRRGEIMDSLTDELGIRSAEKESDRQVIDRVIQLHSEALDSDDFYGAFDAGVEALQRELEETREASG